MKFEELSEKDKEYLRFLYFDETYSHKEKMEILSKKFDVVGRTIRRWWREELNLSKGYTTLPPQLEAAQNFNVSKDTQVLLFTSAQNKTGINREMLDNMEAYKDFLQDELGLKTEIVIAPTRYRNPTSPHETFSNEEWWVDEVQKYLAYSEILFGDVLLSCTTHIRPTTVNPLTGLDLMASNKSVVFPHTKIHLKSMPRFKSAKLRTLSTTGSLTVKNYSDSKDGVKAYEHHSYGFTVIEKAGKECYAPRNVKVNSDGTFTDVIYEVRNKEVTRINSSLGMVLGDIHTREVNKEFFGTTLDLIQEVSPNTVVLHDVFDGATVNPHETDDLFIRKRKIVENKNNIGIEIEEALDLVSRVKEVADNVAVVASNHDVFLDRHVNKFDWKKDLHNSEFYLGLAHIQQTVDLRKYGTIFGYLLTTYDNDIKYIKYGESLRIGDYECGLHGDHGANGSRGNHKQFARYNFKMITAHEHTPATHNGVTVVGITCNKDQYYNQKGLSSWQYAHSIVHNTGKNQLWIFNDDYKFTNLI